MELTIHDVEHGFCAIGRAENGKVLLIDAGTNATTGWTPTRALSREAIEKLVISNFDEDHMSDLPALRAKGWYWLMANWSVGADRLEQLKRAVGGPSRAADAMIASLRACQNGTSGIPDLPGFTLTHYWNVYPDFTDENNLSVVTFLESGPMNIVFPGDLEEAGWERLLKNPAFVEKLSRVKVFVASHHGRVNGCCSSVFEYCRPHIVVISDKAITHGTQRGTVDWYRERCSNGATYPDGAKRYVYTTRNDGPIRFTWPNSNGGWTVHT